MIKAFLCVAAGGAIGSCLRYAVSLIPFKGDFPFATLIANLLGAMLIGFIVGLAEKNAVGQYTVLFLKTGLCGGFTTFSTFSLESASLLENGKTAMGCGYIILSLLGCLSGVILGRIISDTVFGN